MDESFISKSFGGGPTPYLRRRRQNERQVSELKKITHKGYLWKRSNQQFNYNDQSKFDEELLGKINDFPTLPMIPNEPEPLSKDSSDRDTDDVDGQESPFQTSGQRTEPQHATAIDFSSVETVEPFYKAKSPLELGIDAAASFFGLRIGDNHQAHKAQAIDVKEIRPEVSLKPKTSKPIKVSSPNLAQLDFETTSHLQHSDSKVGTSDAAPTHFVAEDGHLWRSKYCVLEDGILYFYRDMMDGDSLEAVEERSEDSTSCGKPAQNSVHSKQKESLVPPSPMIRNVSDLSKSPVTRNILRSGSNNLEPTPSTIWEKRVVLDCVETVRSAEQKYGQNSFELHGIRNEGDSSNASDTLVLRASNNEEMKLWIFQFHRSLVSFMKDILDFVGSRDALIDAESAKPSISIEKNFGDIKSAQRLQRLLARSPGKDSFPHATTALWNQHQSTPGHFYEDDKQTENVNSEQSKIILSTNKESVLSPTSLEMMYSPQHPLQEGKLLPPRNNVNINGIGEFIEKFKDDQTKNEGKKKNGAENLNAGEQVRSKAQSTPSKKTPIRRYIPPSQRKRSGQSTGSLLSLQERTSASKDTGKIPVADSVSLPNILDTLDDSISPVPAIQLGGCADPKLVSHSIMDPINVPRDASKVRKSRSKAFGSCKFGREIGAISECGSKPSNEDSYLIVHDLIDTLGNVTVKAKDGNYISSEKSGLFAIFDGHLGSQAARYAAENLIVFLREELVSKKSIQVEEMETALHDAITKLDDRFCQICVEDGRNWESGTTAIIALVLGKCLVVGNLGDCQGLVCRSIDYSTSLGQDWNRVDDTYINESKKGSNVATVWKDIAHVHKPSSTFEKARIEKANGWIRDEEEKINVGRLRLLDLDDKDVIEILQRCFSDLYNNVGGVGREGKAAPTRILQSSRVCGELAVSRAIGDREFKAAFQEGSNADSSEWRCPGISIYPDDHSQIFSGDLIANLPDFQEVEICGEASTEEFLLFGSDGLWDVLDADDAVRVTRELLFRKKYTAKRAAARLAELAIHLGSEDNITVIVVRMIDFSLDYDDGKKAA